MRSCICTNTWRFLLAPDTASNRNAPHSLWGRWKACLASGPVAATIYWTVLGTLLVPNKQAVTLMRMSRRGESHPSIFCHTGLKRRDWGAESKPLQSAWRSEWCTGHRRPQLSLAVSKRPPPPTFDYCIGLLLSEIMQLIYPTDMLQNSGLVCQAFI